MSNLKSLTSLTTAISFINILIQQNRTKKHHFTTFNTYVQRFKTTSFKHADFLEEEIITNNNSNTFKI